MLSNCLLIFNDLDQVIICLPICEYIDRKLFNGKIHLKQNDDNDLFIKSPILTTPGGSMSKDTKSEKSLELKIFIFLTVFLAPILSVLLVSALGFSIWFSQILTGPPGVG
jgi:nitrate reductase NapE